MQPYNVTSKCYNTEEKKKVFELIIQFNGIRLWGEGFGKNLGVKNEDLQRIIQGMRVFSHFSAYKVHFRLSSVDFGVRRQHFRSFRPLAGCTTDKVVKI